MKQYTFIIDTDQYAGNFERDMCAYITGIVGECGVGEEYADLFSAAWGGEESEIFDSVGMRADEHGCHRPCAIVATPGWIGSSNKAFPDTEEGRAQAFENNQKFNVDYYARLRDSYMLTRQRIISGDKSVSDWTLEGCDASITRFGKQIEYFKNVANYTPAPAYLSVGIYFDDYPTEEQIEIMKERAYEFAALRNQEEAINLNITGFRLSTETTTEEISSI